MIINNHVKMIIDYFTQLRNLVQIEPRNNEQIIELCDKISQEMELEDNFDNVLDRVVCSGSLNWKKSEVLDFVFDIARSLKYNNKGKTCNKLLEFIFSLNNQKRRGDDLIKELWLPKDLYDRENLLEQWKILGLSKGYDVSFIECELRKISQKPIDLKEAIEFYVELNGDMLKTNGIHSIIFSPTSVSLVKSDLSKTIKEKQTFGEFEFNVNTIRGNPPIDH